MEVVKMGTIGKLLELFFRIILSQMKGLLSHYKRKQMGKIDKKMSLEEAPTWIILYFLNCSTRPADLNVYIWLEI